MLCRAATIATLVGGFAVAVAGLGSRDARACGGTFCDAGPAAMPVNQSGENVLFSLRDGIVEAHIQIQYTGNPENFAWVVPVMAEPEIGIGSGPLFNALRDATDPVFDVIHARANCEGGDGETDAGGCSGAFSLSAPRVPGTDGPAVRDRQIVGAYEYAVLDGGTADGVSRWLEDHGYANDDAAEPILEEYLDEGFLFVAFKLRPGAGLDEIHPVIIRYAGDEPCVPLRLTRIAAEDDMGVRVFFLGDDRVVPTNYRHVQLNPLKLDWDSDGANYDDVVRFAVDEAPANGRGFVTEYAGPTAVVETDAIESDAWDPLAFLSVDPSELTGELERQTFYDCDPEGACTWTHPLILGLLERFLPPPAGVRSDEYYACTHCYESREVEGWDTEGFAQALHERVVAPGQQAAQLLRSHRTLTRLYTTISPREMTDDPLFAERAGLPDVSNVWSATHIRDCEGTDRVELSDGRVIWYDVRGTRPGFERMPSAAVIEEIGHDGGPMVLVDNAEDIEMMLETWNAAQEPAPAGCGCRLRRRWRGSVPLLLLMALGLRARRRRR